jgi:hypothetical protein
VKYRTVTIMPRAASICVRAALGLRLPLPRYGLVPK